MAPIQEGVRYQGHLTQGCKGRWVDISSLAQQEWTCSECRATVADPEALDPPPLRGNPGQDLNGEQRRPPIGIWPFLWAVLVGSAIVLGALWLTLFYGNANQV